MSLTSQIDEEGPCSVATKAEDKEAINQQLYQLVQAVNIDIDYEVFCVVADLLRAGVSSEALFVFFSNIYPHTRVGKRIATLKKARKSRVSHPETPRSPLKPSAV